MSVGNRGGCNERYVSEYERRVVKGREGYRRGRWRDRGEEGGEALEGKRKERGGRDARGRAGRWSSLSHSNETRKSSERAFFRFWTASQRGNEVGKNGKERSVRSEERRERDRRWTSQRSEQRMHESDSSRAKTESRRCVCRPQAPNPGEIYPQCFVMRPQMRLSPRLNHILTSGDIFTQAEAAWRPAGGVLGQISVWEQAS